MANLSDLRWAQVPGVDFSPLGDLAKAYREGRTDRAIDDAGKALASGDYATAAKALFRGGKLEAGVNLLKMGLEQQNSTSFQQGVNQLYGGGGGTPPSLSSLGRRADVSNKVYSNNEPSPLDPPSGTDRDLAIRTILAEAGNQGPTGMQAVGNVIRNRAVAGNFGGDTPSGVVTAPNQFEPWNTAAGRGKMAAVDPNSPQYRAAGAALERAYAGDDPTKGATHFYSPTAQAVAGRSAPAWDNGIGQDIGQHRFFGGAGTPSVTAGSQPSDISAQNRPPQVTPQNQKVQFLINAVSSPNIPAGQKEVAKMLLAEEIKSNPEIQKLEAFRRDPGLFQLAKELRQAGATAITNDMRGENAEAAARGKAAGERAAKTMEAASAASRNIQNFSRMEGLLSQVNQGKIEPGRQTVSAWAKSIGLDDGVAVRLGLDPKGVGTAQAVNAMANELLLGKIGSGGMPANNFSNADRDFLTETGPRLANDPKGNALMIEAARRLSKLDIEKARDWNKWRATHKGGSFDDFEIEWNDKVASRNIFGDLQQKAAQIVGHGRVAPSTPTIDGLLDKYAPVR